MGGDSEVALVASVGTEVDGRAGIVGMADIHREVVADLEPGRRAEGDLEEATAGAEAAG